MEHTILETPIGLVRLGTDGTALVALTFMDEPGAPDGGADPGGAVEALRAYFAGELDALSVVRVRAVGTPFQQRVWAALATIPCGSTVSYAELAADVGRPHAVRAVGRANATNPVGIVVPCHRVVRSDGSLGGYGGGLDRKRWLLEHEGAIRANGITVGAHE